MGCGSNIMSNFVVDILKQPMLFDYKSDNMLKTKII